MISEALKLSPASVTVNGAVIAVTRPSVLDMLDALEHSKRSPDTMLAWLVHRHARGPSGLPMFDSIEAVLACDLHAIAALGQGIQKLYEEGRD